MVRCGQLVIIDAPLEVLFLVTASISPSVQAVWELHTLSPGVDTPALVTRVVTCGMHYKNIGRLDVHRTHTPRYYVQY